MIKKTLKTTKKQNNIYTKQKQKTTKNTHPTNTTNTNQNKTNQQHQPPKYKQQNHKKTLLEK